MTKEEFIANLAFRILIAVGYSGLGVYLVLNYQNLPSIGTFSGCNILQIFGLLFVLMGGLRCWRAYQYYKDYEDE